MFRENTHTHTMKIKEARFNYSKISYLSPAFGTEVGGTGVENQPPRGRQAQLRSPHTYNRQT